MYVTRIFTRAARLRVLALALILALTACAGLTCAAESGLSQEDLLAQLNAARGMLEMAQAQNELLRGQLEQLKSQYADVNARCALIEAERDALAAELDISDARKAELESNLALLQITLDEETSRMALMEGQLAAKAAELEAAQTDAQALNDNLTQARSELEIAQATIAQNALELEDVKARLDLAALELEDVRARLESALLPRADAGGEIALALTRAFEAAELTVEIDSSSGAATIRASALFEKGSLSDSGKAYLDAFIGAYLRALLSGEIPGELAQIAIIGHTDMSGIPGEDTYIKDLELSTEYALMVAGYMLSGEYLSGALGFDEYMQARLRDWVTAYGRSYSEPVLSDDGAVDRAASIRIEFKARFN